MEKPTKTLKAVLFILMMMLLTLGITSFFLYKKQQDVIGLNAQKSALITRLADMIGEYNSVEAENDSIKLILDANKNEMVSMIDTIARMTELKGVRLQQFESSVTRLKNQNSKLVAYADSLKQTNTQLKQENAIALFSLKREQNINDSLNVAVKQASALGIINLNTLALNVKRSGETPTTSAWRAEKLKACFDLPANNLAEKGLHTLYLRIINPDKEILRPNGSSLADTSNTSIFYSAKQILNYNGTKLSSCMEYDYDDFDDGQYQIELYLDGELKATQTLLMD